MSQITTGWFVTKDWHLLPVARSLVHMLNFSRGPAPPFMMEGEIIVRASAYLHISLYFLQFLPISSRSAPKSCGQCWLPSQNKGIHGCFFHHLIIRRPAQEWIVWTSQLTPQLLYTHWKEFQQLYARQYGDCAYSQNSYLPSSQQTQERDRRRWIRCNHSQHSII